MADTDEPERAKEHIMEEKQPTADKKAVVEALGILERNRTGILLTGRVKDGKVELDRSALDEISRKFPGAEFAFVAVNAPFDPESRPI